MATTTSPHDTSSNVSTALHDSKKDSNGLVFIIHGGCFVDGDDDWDGQLANYLHEKGGFTVVRMNHDKSDFYKSTFWLGQHIKRFRTEVYPVEARKKCILIGISSGGLLANETAFRRPDWFTHMILVAPVLNPYRRQKRLAEDHPIAVKQKRYFGDLAQMRVLSESAVSAENKVKHTFCLMGRDDEWYDEREDWEVMAKRHRRFMVLEGHDHAALTQHPTNRVLECILDMCQVTA